MMEQNSALLSHMARRVRHFEVTVGTNGAVWINATSPRQVVAVSAMIRATEFVQDADLAGTLDPIASLALDSE